VAVHKPTTPRVHRFTVEGIEKVRLIVHSLHTQQQLNVSLVGLFRRYLARCMRLDRAMPALSNSASALRSTTVHINIFCRFQKPELQLLVKSSHEELRSASLITAQELAILRLYDSEECSSIQQNHPLRFKIILPSMNIDDARK
jgi:hypothetical protein